MGRHIKICSALWDGIPRRLPDSPTTRGSIANIIKSALCIAKRAFCGYAYVNWSSRPACMAGRLRAMRSRGQSHQRSRSRAAMVLSSNRLRMGPGRHAAYNGVRWHIFGDHRAGADDRSVANRDAGEDHGFVADPHIVADDDIAPVVPGGGYVFLVQPPFLEKQREWIGGKANARCGWRW